MVLKIIKSATKSAGKGIKEGIKSDPEIKKMVKKYPKTFNFLKKRLTPNETFGLYLTVGVIVTGIFVYFFLSIVIGLFTQDILVMSDLRILNIARTFWSPGLNKFMFFVTTLGSGEVIFVGTFALSIFFYLLGRWRYLVSLVASVLLGEVFVRILKYSIERGRPPLSISLVEANGYSFPSGHAFMAAIFYGLVAYFVVRSAKRKLHKIFAILFFLILIGFIGYSRIYLGAHWPTDVLAGFASGAAWIAVFITALEMRRKYKKKRESIKARNDKARKTEKLNSTIKLAGAGLFFIWIAFVGQNFRSQAGSQLIGKAKFDYEKPVLIHNNEIPDKLFSNHSRFSETISGRPQEPIHMIIVAKEDDLKSTFNQAGWVQCDRLNLKNLSKLAVKSVLDEPYPQAPGVPSLWDSIPNDLAFEKPTENNSVRERHHVHFWKTPYAVEDGRLIWFATAHYDRTVKMTSLVLFPTHSIDPAIDKEREEIKANLEKTGRLEEIKEFQVVDPSLGKNQAGDLFFTDGKAYIFYLINRK